MSRVLAFVVAAIAAAFVFASHAYGAPPDMGALAAPSLALPAAPSFDLVAWVIAHKLGIAIVLGAWALVASAINQGPWPKPGPAAPQWQAVLHYFLIDGIAFLASKDMRGVFGKLNLPLIPSFSSDGDKSSGASVLLPFVLIGAALLTACASSPYDKARQTLTGIELGRSGAEKALAAYDGPHQLELVAAARARCKPDLPAPDFKACAEKEGRPALDAWRADFDTAVKVFTGLGAAVAVATVGIHALEISHAPGASVDKILQALLPALGDVIAAMKKLGIAPGALAFLAGGV